MNFPPILLIFVKGTFYAIFLWFYSTFSEFLFFIRFIFFVLFDYFFIFMIYYFIFRPAEWRWKLPQVCDDEWHHYAVNVNFPVVTLVVDGEEWTDKKDNPEIIDDWPLHPADDITTKVSIGACWQGNFLIIRFFWERYPTCVPCIRNKSYAPLLAKLIAILYALLLLYALLTLCTLLLLYALLLLYVLLLLCTLFFLYALYWSMHSF